jgi:hypothetical protein
MDPEDTLLHRLVDFDRLGLGVMQTPIVGYREWRTAYLEAIANIPRSIGACRIAAGIMWLSFGLFFGGPSKTASLKRGFLPLGGRTLEFLRGCFDGKQQNWTENRRPGRHGWASVHLVMPAL